MTKETNTAGSATAPSLQAEPLPDGMKITLSGSFTLHGDSPDFAKWKDALPASKGTGATIDGAAITAWDSSLILLLVRLRRTLEERGSRVEWSGFPDSIEPLLARASVMDSGPQDKAVKEAGDPLLNRIGAWGLDVFCGFSKLMVFFGETLQSLGRLIRGKAIFQRSDFASLLWENTGRSIGIVFLISFLTGLILAFVGAIQLAKFGADIFVADLVAIAMFREMGAMMTGVILAGRTGSAFAAQIGSMKANDELNALQTMGISSFDFIVLPRLTTLALMMPVLAFLASLSGILGGMVVSVGFMDITATQYLTQTAGTIGAASFFSGIGKSIVFGGIIAMTGCFKGMAAGSSAESVGNAATSAVVTSIVLIIVADALFAILFNIYGI